MTLRRSHASLSEADCCLSAAARGKVKPPFQCPAPLTVRQTSMIPVIKPAWCLLMGFPFYQYITDVCPASVFRQTRWKKKTKDLRWVEGVKGVRRGEVGRSRRNKSDTLPLNALGRGEKNHFGNVPHLSFWMCYYIQEALVSQAQINLFHSQVWQGNCWENGGKTAIAETDIRDFAAVLFYCMVLLVERGDSSIGSSLLWDMDRVKTSHLRQKATGILKFSFSYF